MSAWAAVVGPTANLLDSAACEDDPIERDLARQLCTAIDAGDAAAVRIIIDAHDLLMCTRDLAAEVALNQ